MSNHDTFDRFQARNAARLQSHKTLNTSFLWNSYPSTVLTNNAGQTIQGVVVNRQEQDVAYIYTQLSTSLKSGEIWSVKGLHLLVLEEIVIIKDVDFHKYKCVLCNFNINGVWGFFKGPEKAHVDVTLHNQSVYTSQQRPVLVLPTSDKLQFRDKIVIKGRAWMITEYDAISTEGITYYSIIPTTIEKDALQIMENQKTDSVVSVAPSIHQDSKPLILDQPVTMSDRSTIAIAPNKQITLVTSDGYFKYNNKSIKIHHHSLTSVTFSIPNGVSSIVDVQVKNPDIITYKYKVVI